MERFTISLDDELAHQFDAHMAARGYAHRSEAVRDLIRRELESNRIDSEGDGLCVGWVSYVYNHHERNLAARLAQVQHDKHDLVLATMHVHLNHDDCIEAMFVKGATAEVRAFAQMLVAERGVRHGTVHLLPLLDGGDTHGHASKGDDKPVHRHDALPT